jgi:cell division protein FtsN
MNNHQRGVYQPAMDNIPIYDLSDDEVEEEEHSRLPLLIVIALLVLAAFAGVVWLAYNQGVARGRAGAAVIIAAPDGPVRTAPATGTGSETPYTGLKVYNQPVPPEQEAQTSTLAPEPPVEVRKSTAAPPPPAKPAPVVTEAPPVRLNPPPAAPAAVAPPPPPVVAQAAPPPAAPAAVAPPAPPPVVARAAPPPATSASSAVSGKAVLQIGAYETQDIANGEWAAFRKRHATAVGGLTEDVQRADLGAKGIWYRLRIGPFADKAAAAAACEKLKSEGGTCFVAAP